MSLSVSTSSFPPATTSARLGMQRDVRRLDEAAGRIARFGLETSPAGDGPDAVPPAGDDLAGAMVDVLVAQRAFMAQLRSLEAASAMSEEAVRLGQSPDAARTTS